MPELCAYVTERATEGSCVYIGREFNEGAECGEPVDDYIAHQHWCEDPECFDMHHDYLGPVLARCEHPESCAIHWPDSRDLFYCGQHSVMPTPGEHHVFAVEHVHA